MSRFYINWFKVRALLFANIQKLFGFLLLVPIPPKVSAGCSIEKDGKILVLDLSYSSEGKLLWLSPEEIQKNQSYSNWKYLLDLYLQK